MAIFSFMARLGLDTAQFESGVKRAQSSAAGLGKSIRGHLGGELRGLGASLAGVFTIGAVKRFASEVVEMVQDIKDMSELLEMSTEDVQRLQKAASEAAIPFTRVVSALQRIEAEKAKALTGDEKSRSLFSMLGIDPGKAGALDILKQTVEASKRGAIENAAAFDLLGAKVGGLKRVVDELNQLGQLKVMSDEDVARIDQASKALENAWRLFKVDAAPVIVELLNAARVAVQAPGILKENLTSFAAGVVGGPAQLVAAQTQMASRLIGLTPEMANLNVPAISALPLPSRQSDQDAAVELLRQMNENTRKTAEALETSVNR